ETVEPGVARVFDASAGGQGAPMSAAAVSLAKRAVIGRNSQHFTDAVVVFDSPDDSAILALGDKRNAVLLGKGSLQAEPYRQGVVGGGFCLGQGCSLRDLCDQGPWPFGVPPTDHKNATTVLHSHCG